jgi:hypothetical protein
VEDSILHFRGRLSVKRQFCSVVPSKMA